MARTLEIEIEALKKRILRICAVVEGNVRDAIKALVMRDTALATKVIDVDEEIDTMEVVMEEECFKTSGFVPTGGQRLAVYHRRLQHQ